MGRTYEETGLVRAHAKWVRTSARKARIVLEHVRGLPVADARVQLRFATRHAADDILRVLDSAIANAVNNHGLEEESLVVAEAFADEGVTMKRWQPRARGRAMRIRKRTAHITILLRSVEPAEAAAESKPKRRGRKAAAPEAAQAAPAKGRRAAKPAEAAPAEEVAEDTAAAEAEAAEETAAPEAEVAEETAAPEAEAAVAEPETAEPEAEADEAAAPDAEAAAEEPAAEAPKPKRTRRKKTDDSDPEGEEA
jgi:large subunit ribosomal protein L22